MGPQKSSSVMEAPFLLAEAFEIPCFAIYDGILLWGRGFTPRVTELRRLISANLRVLRLALHTVTVPHAGVGICRHVAKSGDKDRIARDSGDKAL